MKEHTILKMASDSTGEMATDKHSPSKLGSNQPKKGILKNSTSFDAEGHEYDLLNYLLRCSSMCFIIIVVLILGNYEKCKYIMQHDESLIINNLDINYLPNVFR